MYDLWKIFFKNSRKARFWFCSDHEWNFHCELVNLKIIALTKINKKRKNTDWIEILFINGIKAPMSFFYFWIIFMLFLLLDFLIRLHRNFFTYFFSSASNVYLTIFFYPNAKSAFIHHSTRLFPHVVEFLFFSHFPSRFSSFRVKIMVISQTLHQFFFLQSAFPKTTFNQKSFSMKHLLINLHYSL